MRQEEQRQALLEQAPDPHLLAGEYHVDCKADDCIQASFTALSVCQQNRSEQILAGNTDLLDSTSLNASSTEIHIASMPESTNNGDMLNSTSLNTIVLGTHQDGVSINDGSTSVAEVERSDAAKHQSSLEGISEPLQEVIAAFGQREIVEADTATAVFAFRPEKLPSNTSSPSRRWLFLFCLAFSCAAYMVQCSKIMLTSLYAAEAMQIASEVTAAEELGDTDALDMAKKMRELGHLRLTMSDCQGADRLFERAEAALANRSLLLTIEERQALQSDRGFALVCSERFRDGAEMLKKVATNTELLQSTPAYIANALGYAYFRLRDYGRAKSIFETLVQSNPENPLLWNNLGAASISLGDITTADDALYYALSQARKLAGPSSGYYAQVVSNNIHSLRTRSQGRESPGPHMEIFNCMEPQLKSMVTSTPVDVLEKKYSNLMRSDADEHLSVSVLTDSRKSALSMTRERLLCP